MYIILSSFFCAVVTHYFAKSGKNRQQIVENGLLLDFEVLQSISDPLFVLKYKNCLSTFITSLNNRQKAGAMQSKRLKSNFNKFLLFKFFLYRFFGLCSVLWCNPIPCCPVWNNWLVFKNSALFWGTGHL
jgi:hypothetical protein